MRRCVYMQSQEAIAKLFQRQSMRATCRHAAQQACADSVPVHGLPFELPPKHATAQPQATHSAGLLGPPGRPP